LNHDKISFEDALMYLLDTNVVSELRPSRSHRPHAQVAAWAASVGTEQLFLSAIVLLELQIGVLRKERTDPVQARVLRKWLEEHVLPTFASRVLPVDTGVARRCAALMVPDPRSYRDALIAATALVHGMTVVTRNVGDFEATGVKLLNPWRD
jgi:predicted nucleic acid-binding protein